MSRYGITMRPTMMKVGSTTPACQGTAFNGVAMRSALLALGAAARRPEERDNDEDEDQRNGEHAGAGEHERQHDQDRGADDALQLARHAQRAGPEKPSRRMRQKWTAMKRLATNGMKMQWRM